MTRTILPHQLAGALDAWPDTALLSLDCFDTLLWRDCHAPADLFALLGDVTPQQRTRAEAAARKSRLLARHASAEVTLREIYEALLPHADATVRAEAVAHEMNVEARHCYAFAPTVELMREAKRRGIPVVIVSDTYFEQAQLEWLIRTAAGDEVADLIDRVFCSCEYRSAKGENLFRHMLGETGATAGEVLHIGDNPRADLVGAERHGLNARHLIQFAGAAPQQLRQETVAGAMLAGTGVAWQPHRAALAAGGAQVEDAGEAFGFATTGPVLSAFADWLKDEADELATRGGRVHMLFLMRDGHLPRETFMARYPDAETHAVEISRFTATAASLASERAARTFVADEIGDGAGEDLLRQLLIGGQEAKSLIARLNPKDKVRSLADAVVSSRWLPKVVTRGRAFADRMIAHLRRTCEIEPGDTLMLVDLGYNGTVQNRIDALLSAELGVTVAGRYLLLSETERSGLDKRGFLDRETLDEPALTGLTTSVALLEQLCTVEQGSVVDYEVDGAPIRAGSGIKSTQSAVRAAIQRGTVAYAARGDGDMVRDMPVSPEVRRRGAMAALGRLLFLPLPNELTLIERFEHDANLGTDDRTALFDPELATRGLRERGLFYLKGSKRMFLPAELRGHGLPASLTLLAQRRFGLDLNYADFCDTRVALPILVADGAHVSTSIVNATPTHDGWFVAAIPIGASRFTIGVQFGRLYDHLQIDSVRFVPARAFNSGQSIEDATAIAATPSIEGMEQVAPHLFRCDDNDAFMMVTPPAQTGKRGELILAIVFRPIAERAAVVAQPDVTEAAHG